MRQTCPRTFAAVVAVLAAGCSSAGSRPGASSPAAAGTSTVRQAWRWLAPKPSYVGMPGSDGTGIAVTYGHSHLVVLDGQGRPQWTVDRARLRDVAPTLTPTLVIAPTEDGLVAYDRVSGAQRWEASIGERTNTPAMASGRAVVTTWEGSLAGVDAASGAVVWRTALAGPALGPPGTDGSTAVATWDGADIGAEAGAIAVDAATGRQRWARALPAGGVSAATPVAGDGGSPAVAVLVAGDVAAHALALDTGKERWRAPLQGSGSPEVPPLVVSGHRVLVGHRLGGMALLDATDGSATWQVQSDGATVTGGPAGPGPGGRYAMPLEDGRVLVAGPGRPTEVLDPPGRVSGVGLGPGATLLVATRETTDNDLTASTGW